MTQNFDYQQLVETSADAIMVCDAAGKITLWNAASERMFGHTAQEALGLSLDIIIPQKQQARHWEGYHVTMASGITKYGTSVLRVPAVHKDGHTLSIAFTVSLMRDAAGAVNAIVAVVRDESVKFAEERALRKRISELESKA
jgi:PAS domain S-box-containing protein